MKNILKDFGKRIIYLDGATGSCLVKRGMPAGVCPEKWILEHEEVMIKLQKEYVDAGSEIIYAPTFGGNRIKLSEYGLEDKLVEINTGLVAISKKAAGGKALVAGDVTMTGKQLKPIGTLEFEELVDIYKEQISVLYQAGCDLIVVETMMSLQETRACVIACKEVCPLPIIATLSFEKNGKTLFGSDAFTAATVLEGLGVSAIGANCSTGPDKMVELISDISKAVSIPIIAKPNAGMPHVDANGDTVYDMPPEKFADCFGQIIEAGASVIGGCCGTSPEYIKALKERNYPIKDSVAEENLHSISQEQTEAANVLTSERKSVLFGQNYPFRVIGERINPTGKKKLQADLREGSLEMCLQFAREQEEAGADILDVNLGMSGIDELAMFLSLMNELSVQTNLPLSLDSSDCEVLEAALRIYPGRALVNSVSLEKGKAEKLFPLIKKYGAAFILLPLSENGLPKDKNEKFEIIDKLCEMAYSYGLTKRNIVVDALVTTVSANKMGAIEAIETIEYCKKLGLSTVCGLSNISFGLPERGHVNTAFLTAAISHGLTMAIANPCQKVLMDAVYSTDLLMNHEDATMRYIDYMANADEVEIIVKKKNSDGIHSSEKESGHSDFDKSKKFSDDGKENEAKVHSSSEHTLKAQLKTCVMKGNEKGIVAVTKDALNEFTPEELLNDALMSAINEVGELFNIGKYFLPQLIASANAMKASIEILEPLLQNRETTGKNIKICVATVKGDIHDIGKNLVILMLKNYGYQVYDLGKDVPTDTILDFAEKEDVDIIALSALMTTTMTVMKEVVFKARERNLRAKVIIGGAVVTNEYALEIGADGYSSDAADCVRLGNELFPD